MNSQQFKNISSSSSSSYSSESRVIKQSSYQIQQSGGYQQTLPSNHQQQFIQASNHQQQLNSARGYEIPIQLASNQQQFHQQQRQENFQREYQIPIQKASSIQQSSSSSSNSSSSLNKTNMTEMNSNQGVMEGGNAGHFRPMDQNRPPVATAAASYENTLQSQKQQQEQANAQFVKPEGPSESFPTQWPPQNQVNNNIIFISFKSKFFVVINLMREQVPLLAKVLSTANIINFPCFDMAGCIAFYCKYLLLFLSNL